MSSGLYSETTGAVRRSTQVRCKGDRVTVSQASGAERSGDLVQAVIEDHRVRAARRKREKMRERLLTATLQVCATKDSLSPIVVDDIMRVADVSRGTFYNYFPSAEEAVSAVGRKQADEFSAAVMALRGGISSPVQHVAVANHLFLVRAALEPVWGSYFLRWNYFLTPSKGGEVMISALVMGRKAGDFRFEFLSSAVDFVMGAVFGATRRIVRGEPASMSNICDVQRMILLGLGVSPEQATETLQYTVDYVRAHGGRLGWWRDLEAGPSTSPPPAN